MLSALPFKLPSPLRMLRSLHARLVVVDGPSLENEIMIDEVNRATDQVVAATVEAKAIVVEVHTVEVTLDEITAPDSEGGTAITPTEHRRLSRQVGALHHSARTHHTNLNELAS